MTEIAKIKAEITALEIDMRAIQRGFVGWGSHRGYAEAQARVIALRAKAYQLATAA